jgi:glyoxylase-like metal-dependent hydrolase (beta-lactamase superfamily II)
MNEQFYFRQLLAGRDFAVGDDVATSMRNFTYLLGDRDTGDAILVDPAYRPSELVDMVTADEMNVVGVVATHFHPDHIGGTLAGDQHIAGIAELLSLMEVPVHVQAEEAEWVTARTGVSDDALTLHHDRDQLDVGTVAVTLLHTPGHTPGSQCLLVEGRLLSGDTLFIDGCGRTDFPGGDTLEMYRTLSERLNAVSDETVLFPGHLYAPESFLSMGHVRARNYVFSAKSQEEWLAMFAS